MRVPAINTTVRNGAAGKGRPTICHLVHGLPVGGAEVLVDGLVRRFAGEYRVVIACLDEVGDLGARLEHDGFQLSLLGRRPGFDWRCVMRLAQLLRRERVGLIHAHQYTPFAYALATRAFGVKRSVLFTEHGRFFPDFPRPKRMLFNRVMSRPCDQFVAVGESVHRALVENEGLPAERIEVVYNGVDLDGLAAAGGRDAVRAELGIGEDEFLVLMVARLDPIKDHATALRAVRLARGAAPSIRLLIVGEGPERAAIEELVQRFELGPGARLLGQRRDVPRLLAAADAFLLTSVSEGIPVTLIEAMGAGVPVVSTAVGGVVELIEHERTGLLAPAGDDRQLADALIRLQSTPGLPADIARRACDRARSQFSEERMNARYAELYSAMLNGRRRAGNSGVGRV